MTAFAAIFAPLRLVLPVTLGLLALRGCPAEMSRHGAEETRPHPAITVRKIPVRGETSHVRLIDVDLTAPGVRVDIAAEDIARREGRITGRARSVAEWVEETGAVAGVNGGFFGESVGADHLEIVGLLKLDGRVRVAGPVYRARSGEARYTRSALGLTAAGTPQMGWVSSRPGDPQTLREHAAPEVSGRGSAWPVEEALACGPRLISEGKVDVSFRGERLASPGRLPRTFVGFGGGGSRPQRMVLATATGMEFEECAEFLQRYFREAHRVECREAMCLDGGSSTQAAWREGGRVRTDSPLNIDVPTAVLVYSK